jgi:hypothetical protein
MGKRICFSTNNFVGIRNCRVGRIDGVFLHTLAGRDRLFLVVTYIDYRANTTSELDPVLQLPVYRLTGDRDIIGLPGVATEKMWVLGWLKEDQVVHVDYDIFFM